MITMTFKTKIRDGQEYIDVPKPKRSHFNMAECRKHKKYGGYANSDLFIPMVQRDLKRVGKVISLKSLPDHVSVDDSGFLAKVTIGIYP